MIPALRCVRWSAAILFLIPATLCAQTPRLLRDINLATPVVSSTPGPFVESGSWVWFPATLDAIGRELFAVDRAATAVVRGEDVEPGPGSSDPEQLVAFAGGIVFVARRGPSTVELRLAHPASPTSVLLWSGTSIAEIEAAGPTVFFTVWTPVGGTELWSTDGTATGARLSRTFSTRVAELTALGSTVLFPAFEPSQGRELWRSDGTVAGTTLFVDLMPGSASSHPRQLVGAAGARAFFVASDSNGTGVWATDGTVAGTIRLETALAEQLTAAGSNLYYLVGWELRFSDGTAAGTRPVRQLVFGGPRQLRSDGTRAFYTDGGLWVSDGSAAGTLRLATGRAILGGLAGGGGRAFALLDDDLWSSDGTVAGTVRVAASVDRGQSAELPQGLALSVSAGGRAFFIGRDARGDEPWTSDGTAQGTRAIVDLRPPLPGATVGSSAGLGWLAGGPGAGRGVFLRDDGVHGAELWRTDGTTAGTALVVDLTPGPESTPITSIGPQGDVVWFTADANAVHPSALWRTDGTAAGTVRVLDAQALGGTTIGSARGLLQGGVLLFGLDSQLWRSDGTPRGSFGLGVPGGVVFGGGADLALVLSTTGEVWQTDGTVAGTVSIVPGHPNQAVAYLGAFRGGHVLQVYNATRFPTGTLENTTFSILGGAGSTPLSFPLAASVVLLDDRIVVFAGTDLLSWGGVNPPTRIGTFSSFGGLSPGVWFPAFAVGDAVYFEADDGVHGNEVWRSDGTAAGTRLVLDLHPGTASTAVGFRVPVGDRFVFWADTPGAGSEPWTSDGTPGGTSLLADLEPGPGSSAPTFGGFWIGSRRVVLGVETSAAGREHWLTDGTSAGSRFLGDLRPGSAGSFDEWGPGGGVLAGRILIEVDDGLHGSEPWVFELDGVATRVDAPCAAVPSFVVADPVLGAPWRFRIAWMPSGAFGLAVVGLPAPRPLALGGGCALHLDPSSSAVLAPIVPAATGSWTFGLTLPNLAALAGVHLVAQPVFASPASPAGVVPGQAWSAVLGR